MITITTFEDENYTAPDSAIAQLEAHETITGAKVANSGDDTLYSIPFHAIDHVFVYRDPITPVTPSDDLCGGGDSCDCSAYNLVLLDDNGYPITCDVDGTIEITEDEYGPNLRLVYTEDGPDEAPPEFTLTSDNPDFGCRVWFNDDGPYYQGMVWTTTANPGDKATITVSVPSVGCEFSFKLTAVSM